MSANDMESCSAEEVTEGREELRPGRGSGGLGRGGGAWSEEWSRLNLTPNKHLQSPARPLVSPSRLAPRLQRWFAPVFSVDPAEQTFGGSLR